MTTHAEGGATATDGRGTSSEELLKVEGLSMRFSLSRGLFGTRGRMTVGAVQDVDLTLRRGETLGLVGESGCGKTTLGRCILRAHRPTAGSIRYADEAGGRVDLARLRTAELRPYRRQIRMVFQDPNSSLNPRMTVQQIVGEPLRVNNLAKGTELQDRVAEALRWVGLRPELMRRYPHAFSGGERQRVGVARALVTRPRLVIADEAVSALDVSVRSQILNLLEDLQEELDLTYLFISHDLSVIRHLCDRVAVMYVGRIIEQAPVDQLFARPRHPYTETLLRALPVSDPRLRGARPRVPPRGEVPDPAHPPAGCTFHPRCPYATAQCETTEPDLMPVGEGARVSEDAQGAHRHRCHYGESLELTGVTNPDIEGDRATGDTSG